VGGKIIYPIDRIKLRLHIETDKETNNFVWKCLYDNKNNSWGEYIDFHYNCKKVSLSGFNVYDEQIGIWTRYNKEGEIEDKFFFSILNPGNTIEEAEYKKELAMIRLGIIKVPALDIKISDYEK
jgi:hypothetical protein